MRRPTPAVTAVAGLTCTVLAVTLAAPVARALVGSSPSGSAASSGSGGPVAAASPTPSAPATAPEADALRRPAATPTTLAAPPVARAASAPRAGATTGGSSAAVLQSRSIEEVARLRDRVQSGLDRVAAPIVAPVPTDPTTEEPAPSVPPATDRFDLGVSLLAMWSDWDVVDAMFARAAQSGVRSMRVDTGWCSLEENGRGRVSAWYQQRLDHVVAKAQALDIELLVMVGCTPGWAGGQSYHDLPASPAEYQRAMTYLAKRYAGRVAAWELWNEPDCIGGCGKGSPEAYVPTLKAGYKGVKAGDPDALVVTGGISGNNLRWLERMYAAGAAGSFDVLATHPYLTPTTAAPEAKGDGQYSISSVEAVHDLMVRYGDGDKKIWFTEYGWSTPGAGADRPGVTPAQQAEYLTRSVAMIQKNYPYVSRAYWFMMRDRDDSTPYENAFGLIERNGTLKPSYTAFSKAVASLAP